MHVYDTVKSIIIKPVIAANKLGYHYIQVSLHYVDEPSLEKKACECLSHCMLSSNRVPCVDECVQTTQPGV